MSSLLTKEALAPYREEMLSDLRSQHIRSNSAHDGRLFFISTAYPGYWLEHLYDPIAWAKLFPEDTDIAISQSRLFLNHQRQDGMIPSYILDNDMINTLPQAAKAYTGSEQCPPGLTVYHRLIQECVSVGSLCLEICDMAPQLDLAWYYERIAKWENWLCQNRMTRKEGLVEIFCGNETGHDNSGRFFGMKHPGDLCAFPHQFREGPLTDCPVAPLICPDVNAVFYGNRMALATMARRLGKEEEALQWEAKAKQVKEKLMELCFDEKECFFFDVDKNGKQSKVKSISVTTLYCEGVLDQDLADEIYERHLANPKEFATPYPFPGVALSDATWQQKLEGNDWGYYSQGNVALRTLRWMKRYGREAELHRFMEAWLSAWCRPDVRKFGQELHPITGVPSKASKWYSTTMLYLLSAMRELGLDG